ncbi:phage holin family protein [Serratia aquatilis]|uniref:Phage holin family protein n=1 Tax=Serratia aquatilis TaxID=1737515 RepID=A0ABV6EGD2_9GAMM
MSLHDAETFINAVVCTVTFVRLFLFNRNGAEFALWGGLLAWGLMFATGSVSIRILLGAYEGTTDPAELFINVVLCLLVLCAKGNVVKLFKVNSR